MKFTLIQRKERGPWYLRVRLNGLDQKINLGTDSKQKANKLAPAKYDEFVRTATVDGAFNELTALLDRLPKEEAKRKRGEFRAKLNVAKSGDLPTMSDFWKRWEKLPSTQRRVSHIDDVARWERWIQFLSEKDLKDCRLDEIDEHVANQFALHLDEERLTRWSDPVLCTNCHERFGSGFSLPLFGVGRGVAPTGTEQWAAYSAGLFPPNDECGRFSL